MIKLKQELELLRSTQFTQCIQRMSELEALPQLQAKLRLDLEAVEKVTIDFMLRDK